MKKKIYDKYVNGDSLTNKEVLEGMEQFKKAADALIGLGSTFRLACNEANHVYWNLRSFAIARGIYKED